MGRNPFQISYYFKRRFYSAAFLLQLSFNTVTGRVVTVWVDGWMIINDRCTIVELCESKWRQTHGQFEKRNTFYLKYQYFLTKYK